MASVEEKDRLKQMLLRDVSYICCRRQRQWLAPVVQTLKDIREANAPAVFFGGTLRSLLFSRMKGQSLGRPRDIDIVIANSNIEDVAQHFENFVARRTRFGGLQLHRRQWQFDVWPLDQTWSFVNDSTSNPTFADLPSTTFFNLEAIAVDVWPSRGHSRQIYSGDDRFFEGMLSETIEINKEENPYPELCVIRSFAMASQTEFKIGPRLAKYLAVTGPQVSDKALRDVQVKHYGAVRCEVPLLRTWINYIAKKCRGGDESPIHLPMPRQRVFWEEPDASSRLHTWLLKSVVEKRPTRGSKRNVRTDIVRSQATFNFLD